MDGLPQNQTPQPSVFIKQGFLQSTKGKLIAAGTGLILLLLILLILNYFTGAIPQLPHRILSQKAPSQAAQNSIQTVESPVGKTVLTFLSTILNSLFAPSRINIISKDSGAYAASWQAKEGTASATITTKNEGKTITSIILSIPTNTTASIEASQTIIPSVFSVQPKGSWACAPLYKDVTYCENFWEETGLRRGVGIVGPPSEVFFCQRSKESPLYDWKSCIINFSKTGLK